MENSSPDARLTAGSDAVLAGVRRLLQLGDTAGEPETILSALARELMATVGAEEVHVHQLSAVEGLDVVAVYLLSGDGRLSYLQSSQERPAGVTWVSSTARSFLAVGPQELSASVPRLALTCPAAEGELGCALLAPVLVAGVVETVVMLVRRSGLPFDERALDRAVTLVDQAATALALVRARAEAGTDAVAGCMNHRAMRRRLLEEIGRARRARTPLSCLMVDLDDFKLVNDSHGHPVGDTMLREVAQALMGEFRAFDRVARYGGDEFVVILPHADIDAAAAAGARALGRLKAVQVANSPRGVSASIGAAQWREPMGVDELLAACDAALLARKRQGKAGVTRASASPTMAVHV